MPKRNIATGTGDKVSKIVSERTYRGNTKSRGKRRRGKERNGWSLPNTRSSSTTCTPAKHSTTTIIYTTGRKENTQSLATKTVKGLATAHNYNTGEEVKAALDYMATTRPQVKFPSGRQRMT